MPYQGNGDPHQNHKTGNIVHYLINNFGTLVCTRAVRLSGPYILLMWNRNDWSYVRKSLYRTISVYTVLFLSPHLSYDGCIIVTKPNNDISMNSIHNTNFVRNIMQICFWWSSEIPKLWKTKLGFQHIFWLVYSSRQILNPEETS